MIAGHRPPDLWRGLEVPVLLSGNHGEIARWRASARVSAPPEVRPDLL